MEGWIEQVVRAYTRRNNSVIVVKELFYINKSRIEPKQRDFKVTAE